MTQPVGIIGFGAIAQDLVAVLMGQSAQPRISVLVRDGRETAARAALGAVGLPDEAVITSDLSAFLATRPTVVAECAGHAAVGAYGTQVLEAGSDLVVASVGALADAALFDRLKSVAQAQARQVVVPSGAIGGIDVLAAAHLSDLTSVRYTGRKPPGAWAGTPAEAKHDLSRVDTPTIIFEGSARAAAEAYPKNANVAATLALAGLGMDHTQVTLVADPTTADNIHEFTLASSAVEASVQLVGKPSPRNPKTSQTTALSIARAVLNRSAAIVI
ncbi:aspartate dehydrogenase [Marivita sp. S6314]|uniref:aspartate dehydrogenase n=1 Tax=Marivita sp. S6314 TaxID=2926406 RepID=UPI001FF16E29|nr:aspartate dehydrogenase [Marivita sp. S6314]MCK0150124.1 aspartate dehydrogenase [Marivita sp. S6314]